MTWSRGRRPNITFAAVFWTCCSCRMTFRQSGKNAVTVVQSTDDECVDKLFQHLLVDIFTYSGRHTNRQHSKSSNLCQACIKDYYITASHINRSEGAQLSHQYISFGSIQHTGNLYNSTFVNSRHHCQLRSFRYDEQFLWIIRTAFCCWHRFWKFLNARQE